jgi:hypothetical protein
MYYNTRSYEHVKEQLQERLAEVEQLRLCAKVSEGRQGVLRNVATQVGGLLIRLGSRLAQPEQRLEQASR